MNALKSHNSERMSHHSNDLIMLFNDLFRESCQTVLVGGGDEPEYIPAAGPGGLARIVFTRDYFSSALHEISHWCIAGSHRRTLLDYGYWYCPDGRTAEQQQAFEQVEIKPQALEWLFSIAAGKAFNLSTDNLSGGGAANATEFRLQVASQGDTYIAKGLPERAALFHRALLEFYGTAHRFIDDWNARYHAEPDSVACSVTD